jgi:type IX secretion system PorP/SprF family membrane protein
MKQLIFIIIALGLIPSTKVGAQADISMATHWYNRANYNPASITRTEYLYLFTNASQQWIGVDGAPRVFNLQASEYIHSLRSAFGLSFVSDKIGVTQAFNPMLTYAYRIAKDPTWSFSMGLSGGMFMRSVNGSLFEAEIDSDPSLHYNVEKKSQPDANVGFEFQCTHFIFSISSTHLFSFAKSDNIFLNTNHRYASAIYKNTSPELFNYNIGLQVVSRYNLTVVEGNVSLRFKRPTGLITTGPKEIFDLGLTYRTSRQMTLLCGLNISNNLRAGYAYNQSFISGYYLNGTHELMLEFRIPNKTASVHSQCGIKDWYH